MSILHRNLRKNKYSAGKYKDRATKEGMDPGVPDLGEVPQASWRKEGEEAGMNIEEVDRNGHVKEKISYRNSMLHYGLYTPGEGIFPEIPWHWHREFEFGCLTGGSIRYKTSRQEFLLEEGDAIFVNSGVLHALYPVGAPEKIRLHSQFFDREFLAGMEGSIFDLQYIAPVAEQKSLDAVPIYSRLGKNAEFLEGLHRGIALSQEEGPFFGLRLRSLFSRLWETVYGWAAGEEQEGSRYNAAEDERIKQMLTWIGGHYREKLTVEEIARAAHVSRRECHRLFRKGLGTTPAEYTLSLRLQKARDFLLYTDKSILEIALETGFGTSSYFGKIFRQNQGMAPGKYRRMYRSIGM